MTEQQSRFASERQEKVELVECSHVADSGLQSGSLAACSSSSQRQLDGAQLNKVLEAVKPLAKSLMKNAASVTSQIVSAVWDDWENLTMLQKILAAIAIALVAATVGYCSWKLIAGNWTAIKAGVEQVGAKMLSKAEEVVQNFDPIVSMKAIMETFAARSETRQVTLNRANATELLNQFGGFGYFPFLAMIATAVAAPLGLALADECFD